MLCFYLLRPFSFIAGCAEMSSRIIMIMKNVAQRNGTQHNDIDNDPQHNDTKFMTTVSRITHKVMKLGAMTPE
jgi:hypothetical protein